MKMFKPNIQIGGGSDMPITIMQNVRKHINLELFYKVWWVDRLSYP
jgi:hypothetical protein